MLTDINKIYGNADDQHVRTYIVFADDSNKIYYDEAHTASNEVPAADCLNLFMKGVIAKKGDKYFAAKTCTAAGAIDFGFTA